MTNRAGMSPIERLLYGGYEDENGCWLRAAAKCAGGYTRLMVGKKKVLAHRFSYEFHRGDIPAGLQIDHLCRNRACFNPWHLEPVSAGENLLRGEVGTYRRRWTRCRQGHELAGENLMVNHRGWRNCRQCVRRYQRDYKREQRRRGRS